MLACVRASMRGIWNRDGLSREIDSGVVDSSQAFCIYNRVDSIGGTSAARHARKFAAARRPRYKSSGEYV